MKKLNINLKIALIALAVFILFIISFFIHGELIQNGIVSNVEFSQSIQGILAFIFFIPLITALFFGGKYFKSKGYGYGTVLMIVSVALLVFGIIQALLSLIGVYG